MKRGVALKYSITASKGILKGIGLVATSPSIEATSSTRNGIDLPNEESYETFGTVDLQPIDELVRFASTHWQVIRASTMRHRRTFKDDFQIVLLPYETTPNGGGDTVSDIRSRGLFMDYLNVPDFKKDNIKMMSKIRLYMSILRFAVIGIRKDLHLWLINANDRGSLAPRASPIGGDGTAVKDGGGGGGNLELPFIVAPLTDEECVLYYGKEKKTGTWRFIYRSKSESYQKLYDFHVCHDPSAVAVDPIPVYTPPFGEIGVFGGRRRRMDNKRFNIPSEFYQLREKAMEFRESKHYYFTSAFANAYDRNLWGQRPLKEIAPELISAEVLTQSLSVTAASDKERQNTNYSSFLTGMLFAKHMTEIGRTPSDEADEEKRLDAMREFGRYDAVSDPKHLPMEWALLKPSKPTCDIDLEAKEDKLLEDIARIFELPFSHLKGTFEGVTGRTLKEDDTNAIKEQQEETTKQERALMNYIFNWIYQRTFACYDLILLHDSLESYNAMELQAVENAIAEGKRHPRLTRTERRKLLYAALGGKAKKIMATTEKKKNVKNKTESLPTSDDSPRGMKRKRQTRDDDEEDDDDNERSTSLSSSSSDDEREKEKKAVPPCPTVADLRELILAKLGNHERLVAHLIFESDVKQEMETMKMSDHEFLDESVRNSRLEEGKLLDSFFKSGIISSDSAIKQANEMLGWKLQRQGDKDLPTMGAKADAAAKRMKKKAKTTTTTKKK